MSCNCKNTPVPPTPPNPPIPPTPRPQPTFLDIVKDNSVTPPNNTYKMRLEARVGTEIFKGTGYLTYISEPNTPHVSYYFQTILEGEHAPFIPPVNGLGFLNKYEFKSYDKGTFYDHSFITNKVNISDANTNFHINAEPANTCCCCYSCCGDSYEFCTSCNLCSAGGCCASGSCG